MFSEILCTSDNLILTLLRLTLGIVFFAHGSQKMLGWFGGYGFKNTMAALTTQVGIPTPFAFLVIAAEFFGGLGLIFGLFGRVAALGVLLVMLGAIFMGHLRNGFFMNWNGNQKGEGFEFHLLAIAMALAIAIGGSGAFSLDHTLSKSKAQAARQINSKGAGFNKGAASDHSPALGINLSQHK